MRIFFGTVANHPPLSRDPKAITLAIDTTDGISHRPGRLFQRIVVSHVSAADQNRNRSPIGSAVGTGQVLYGVIRYQVRTRRVSGEDHSITEIRVV